MLVQVLCVRAASYTCALQLTHVVETMRPLPVAAMRGAPDFVRGLAVIRGAPAPVIDVAALLCAPHERAFSRFVSLRAGERRVVLGVDAVLGIRELEMTILEKLPSLLGERHRGVVEAMGTDDQHLLLALSAARLLQDETWRVSDETRSKA